MTRIYVIDMVTEYEGVTTAGEDEYFTSLSAVKKEVKRLNASFKNSTKRYEYRKLSPAKPKKPKAVKVKFDSSNLKAGKYYKDTGVLLIKFTSDAVYRYEGVSRSEFGQLCVAESQGSYFATSIKPNKKCTKVK